MVSIDIFLNATLVVSDVHSCLVKKKLKGEHNLMASYWWPLSPSPVAHEQTRPRNCLQFPFPGEGGAL